MSFSGEKENVMLDSYLASKQICPVLLWYMIMNILISTKSTREY